jgi:hypothetical protein
MRKLNMRFEERDEIHDLLVSKIDWSNYEHDIEQGNVDRITSTQILIQRCGLSVSSITKRQTNLCSEYMREITGRDANLERFGGTTARIWLVPKKE